MMTKIAIQFHASPHELATFTASILARWQVNAVLVALRPYSISTVSSSNAEDEISRSIESNRVRIAFSESDIQSVSSSPMRFLDANPTVTILEIGRLTEKGLEESCLSFNSDTDRGVDLANRIASELKKVTKAGATAIDPGTGATSRLRSHRYTAGAKDLSLNGVKMRPVAGTSEIIFNDGMT